MKKIHHTTNHIITRLQKVEFFVVYYNYFSLLN
jgi:hypothetical protein